MPFVKGKGGRPKGSRNVPKTLWILQSLAEHGVNLQDLMAKTLIKAAKGDKQALELSHLLAKFLPHIANAPKSAPDEISISTLVINRYNAQEPVKLTSTEPINTEAIAEGLPLINNDSDQEINIPSQKE